MSVSKQFFLIAASAVMLSACSGRSETPASEAAKGGGDATLQQTLSDPAPKGEAALNVEVLAQGLDHPWSIAFLPDGGLLVTERAGQLRVIRDGALVESPVEGVPGVHTGGQAGLFEVLLHPQFADNQLVYLTYAHGNRLSNATRVARAHFDGERLSDLEVLYEAVPEKDTNHHFGGRMAWGEDGKLYVTIGEGSKYKERAQVMDTSFGAVIRINEDGSIPDDNPVFGDGSRPELFTKGHRNPQGLVFDSVRGVLWEHEHGPRGGDEINIIEGGKNYGWPFASYGIDYTGAIITPFTEYAGTEQPVKYWVPSIAPSGLAVYRGDLFSDWDGDLLVGALAGAALHHVRMTGNAPSGEERYLLDRAERVRDVRVGPDGAVYLATEESRDGATGKILRLTPQ